MQFLIQQHHFQGKVHLRNAAKMEPNRPCFFFNLMQFLLLCPLRHADILAEPAGHCAFCGSFTLVTEMLRHDATMLN